MQLRSANRRMCRCRRSTARSSILQVKDAKFSSLGASYCKLGEGDVPVEKFLTRLRGIGYGGWVTYEWEKAWLPNLAPPEEALPDAIKKLHLRVDEGCWK